MNKIGIFIGIVLTIFTGLFFTVSKGEEKPKVVDSDFRGIVVYPSDITSIGAVELVRFMREANLNLLGIHTNSLGINPMNGGFEDLPSLKAFLESKEGQLLLDECEKQHIEIEYETHALQEILPRELFDEHPEYFRMDENGERQKDHNMCFSSENAFLEIEKNIVEIVKWLKPTTHRYFFWTDDVNNTYCHCDLCKNYTGSEQTLLYENRLLHILRKIDPLATLAHLAYGNTLTAPVKVKPSDGIFLEYAPISRDYTKPLSEEHLQSLRHNLIIFPAKTAHVLEYWLDASMFSRMIKVGRNNVAEVPWNIQNCERDVKLYTGMGIKSITTFATWMISSDYVKKYGEDNTLKVVSEYGSILKKYLK
jgi:hypothetical protein